MFNNIGGKIKILATLLCWGGIFVSIIFGMIIISLNEIETLISGLITMAIGSLISWLSSFFCYGFGQLIENSDILVKQGNLRAYEASQATPANNVNRSSDSATQPTPVPRTNTHMWRCEGCGRMIDTNFCRYCGKKSDDAVINQ